MYKLVKIINKILYEYNDEDEYVDSGDEKAYSELSAINDRGITNENLIDDVLQFLNAEFTLAQEYSSVKNNINDFINGYKTAEEFLNDCENIASTEIHDIPDIILYKIVSEYASTVAQNGPIEDLKQDIKYFLEKYDKKADFVDKIAYIFEKTKDMLIKLATSKITTDEYLDNVKYLISDNEYYLLQQIKTDIKHFAKIYYNDVIVNKYKPIIFKNEIIDSASVSPSVLKSSGDPVEIESVIDAVLRGELSINSVQNPTLRDILKQHAHDIENVTDENFVFLKEKIINHYDAAISAKYAVNKIGNKELLHQLVVEIIAYLEHTILDSSINTVIAGYINQLFDAQTLADWQERLSKKDENEEQKVQNEIYDKLITIANSGDNETLINFIEYYVKNMSKILADRVLRKETETKNNDDVIDIGL